MVEERAHRHERRVVDEHPEVEAAGGGLQVLREPRVGKIQFQTARLDPVFRGEPPSDLFQEAAAARHHRHVHAAFGERRGEGLPEPLGGARNHRPFSVAVREGAHCWSGFSG